MSTRRNEECHMRGVPSMDFSTSHIRHIGSGEFQEKWIEKGEDRNYARLGFKLCMKLHAIVGWVNK